MKKGIYTVALELHKSAAQHTLHMRRRDTAWQLRFLFTDGGRPYLLSEGCYAMFAAKNSDGLALLKDCAVDGNTAVFDVTEAVTHVAGELACELRLYSPAGELLTSPRFTIWVEDTVCDEGDEDALQDNADALSSLIGEAANARNAANAAASYANAVADTVRRAYEDGQLQGEKGDTGEKGDKGEKGEKGDKGDDGYTPVKGVDYFTEAEKQAFLADSAMVTQVRGKCVAVADMSDFPLQALTLSGCVPADTMHVVICGKNLFDREKAYASFLGEGTSIRSTTGGYYIDFFTGTQGQDTVIPAEYLSRLPYLPAGTYTVSYQTTANPLNIFAVSATGKIGEKLTSSTLGNTFTLSAGTSITMRKAGNDKTTVYTDVQLEAGEQATAYEAYQEQRVFIEVADDTDTYDVLAQYPQLHGYKPFTTVLIVDPTDIAEAPAAQLTYRLDTKAYIDNKFARLEAALLSTGANV